MPSVSSATLTAIYAATLHVASLVALVVLVAIGKVSWVDGGPIIAALVGFGAGVPVTVGAIASRAPSPPTPSP